LKLPAPARVILPFLTSLKGNRLLSRRAVWTCASRLTKLQTAARNASSKIQQTGENFKKAFDFKN